MKKRYLLFIGILCILFSCTTNENDFLDNHSDTVLQNDQNRDSEAPEIISSFVDSPESDITDLNEIIIKYQPEISEDEKELLRDEYGVVSYITCDCTNGNQKYELWIMEFGIDIETTVKVIKRKNPDEVSLVAPNKGFNTPMHAITIESEAPSDVVYIESMFNDDYLNKIVPSNYGITVAILDTGIDTDQPGFSNSFLYNSSLNGNCGEESGWDFVNHDKNTYDDHLYKHGTVVSYIVHNQLIQENIDHQILPIKIVDYDGKSTFFKTLCGLKYAIEKESDVINMSFGWESTDPDMYDLFSDLIDTTDATIVTSAGNKNLDNDVKSHYPSNFPQDHILSVAAAKNNLSDVTSYSNYGANTVDFYAIGNKIAFPLGTPNTFSNFYGTSFAAPQVSAKVATLLSNNFRDIRTDLRQQFAIPVHYFSKPVFYMELIE